MSPDLPDVHARYFAAQNDHDIDAIVACFAPAAAVRDEGRNIVRAGAIPCLEGGDQTKVSHWRKRSDAVSRMTGQSLSRKFLARSMAVR